jgi:hypothetical protein
VSPLRWLDTAPPRCPTIGAVGGTEVVDGPTDDVTDDAAPPAPAVTVRLRGVRTFRIIDDEDEPVLFVSDGETTVEFACGISGLSGSAARGARRLANAIGEFATVLELKVSPPT